MKNSDSIKANAPFSEGKFISYISIEVNAHTIRMKALNPGSVS